ncbi:MAG TPA: YciI family protein [Micromonosporaceae bacterium]|nr:YciI family protein [Micromonosporaceae bacterium]
MAVFAVITARGPKWDPAKGIREQRDWDAHADWADRLTGEGVIVLGGPIGGDRADEVALLMVECADEVTLRSTFATDPWAATDVLRIKGVRPWTLWLDSR